MTNRVKNAMIVNNTIKKITIYLAGAIKGCSDNEANGWRDELTRILHAQFGDKIRILNPMVRDYRSQGKEKYVEIVEFDKEDIINSEIVVVLMTKPSIGTSMEILYAWERGKYVIPLWEGKDSWSPWLTYHSLNELVNTDRNEWFDRIALLIQQLI